MEPIRQTYRWKPDWPDTAARLTRWWHGEAMALYLFTEDGTTAPAPAPLTDAATPALAASLYEAFIDAVRARGVHVECGQFRAQMDVELVNDGPVTLLLDSEKSF